MNLIAPYTDCVGMGESTAAVQRRVSEACVPTKPFNIQSRKTSYPRIHHHCSSLSVNQTVHSQVLEHSHTIAAEMIHIIPIKLSSILIYLNNVLYFAVFSPYSKRHKENPGKCKNQTERKRNVGCHVLQIKSRKLVKVLLIYI